MSFALEARGLHKHFGDLVAVAGIDLRVKTGTCLALLGPNGAGKTTTVEMLTGLQTPTQGSISVLGLDWRREAAAIRARIGVQLQETKLQEKVTVAETLRMFRSFYEQGRSVDEALDLVGLREKADARIESLSGGQHQRVALASSLIGSPELLFLDEPSTGLDPQARRRVWQIVEDFKAAGGTVLLTTHYMEEAERLADEVVIVDAGRVIADGTPKGVIGRLDAESIVELYPGEAGLAALQDSELRALPGIRELRREGAALTFVVDDTQASVGALLGLLRERGVQLESLQTHAPTLEDVFVDLTGKQLRDD